MAKKYVTKFDGLADEEIYVKDLEASGNIEQLLYWKNNVDEEITSLHHHNHNKVILVMDSYGATYPQNLIDNAGWKLFWKAGAGFDINNGTNFKDWAIDEINKLSASELYSYDKIIFLGGFNDRNTSQENILSGIAQCREKLARVYVSKRLNFDETVMCVGHVGWSSLLESSERDKMFSASIPAYKRCREQNIAYVDNIEYVLHKYSLFQSDNVHPSTSGCTDLHYFLRQYAMTGNSHVDRGYTTIPMIGAGTTGPYAVGYWQHDGFCELYLPFDTIGFSTNKLLDGNNPVQLLQLQNSAKDNVVMGMFDDGNNVQHMISLSGYFTVASGGTSKFISFDGMKFFIQGGFLWCLPSSLNGAHSGFDTGYVSSMQIRSGSVSVPLMFC